MKKIGVLLAGSGFLDGAEIREAVLTLLAIDKYEGKAIIFAPNNDQYDVVNHLKKEPVKESRNTLEESARIARGEIQDIKEIQADDLDALILPGGFGVAKNLSDFAFKGEQSHALPEVQRLIVNMHKAKKPIGGICIAPALIGVALKDKKIKVTLGEKSESSQVLENLGVTHEEKGIKEVCLDKKNKIVTTPAYMYENPRLKDVAEGIEACVKEVFNLI